MKEEAMGYPEQGVSFERIVRVSISRANRWHNGDMNEWSALEWAGAMCGEAGEAANAAKKLKRLECNIESKNEPERHFRDSRAAQLAVIKEACDTILYAVLVMARAGSSPEDAQQALCNVFNSKSEEYGFPERLGF
jgi:hypothetical protein